MTNQEKQKNDLPITVRANYNPFRQTRPSIVLHMIRHAESANNEVYRNAKALFRAGKDDFDEEGCDHYVSTHRKADPELSTKGYQQADILANNYLVPHLENQASHPIRILCSPMRRTLLTIKPTLERLQERQRRARKDADSNGEERTSDVPMPIIHIIVVAFYHETEGCHLRGSPESGMTPTEIRELMKDCVQDPHTNIEFVGFDSSDSGWYAHGRGPETRADAEERAAKYCLWLGEYLDQLLLQKDHDLFDAGVLVDGEDQEDEHDRQAQRIRRRRTVLAIGHGDFMSSVVKRIVSGFGHVVEMEGIPHRSAFAHYNTGITELEYFGHGRYLVMSSNSTPHIPPNRYGDLRSGGTLRDGWSFLVPPVLEPKVEIIFSDDHFQDHVREQATALKALYLSTGGSSCVSVNSSRQFSIETETEPNKETHFIAKRGLQVVGVATYSEETCQLRDVAIRPIAVNPAFSYESGNPDISIAETLIQAVKKHARKVGRSNSLIVHARSKENKAFFEKLGFTELEDDEQVGNSIVAHNGNQFMQLSL
ncbi:acetyltransferase GNAT domain containing protein [Nitzschia inconspicua]|uniref:Acetyltransferase GNAT domain containing protein n=1 Tax=Nitzschia inconspicua TaxID=303405 RepID=A0A9K3L933_9STRA|nr:acetyltransferase GNAT domain containing protein [Nitzschia inconspicua]